MSFDHQVIEKFNQELDHLLNTGELPAEIGQDTLHNEMLSIANTLATAKVEVLSKGRASLRNRLLSNNISQPMPRVTKVATVLALVFALLSAAFTISPTLRAWAQAVLARVGNLIITDAPTDMERRLPRSLTATPESVEWKIVHREPLSQEEASQRAGFAVLLPRDIPKGEDIYAAPGWIPWKDGWDIYETPNGVIVGGVYDRWYSVRILQLKLSEEQSKDFPIGDVDIIEVTVRGQTGYWIEEAATSSTQLVVVGNLEIPDPKWQIAYENILTWEEEGIVYLIQADDELSLDTLLMIAESLAP